MEQKINSCFENTRHLTQTKEKNLDKKSFHSKNLTPYYQGKAGEEPLSRDV